MFASVAALWSDGAMKSRVMRLGLTSEELREGLDRVATIEPAVARALERVGYPEPRTSAPGYGTLLRTIVGQQVSVAAARSIWNRSEEHTSELQSLMRLSYAVFCLKKKTK